ncbi:hypothetical protein BB558_006508 [Smittium angustum]|uniref:ADP-ribosylation factor n=1 Tax=Smittium angustum TaxID=133377 RepID=A0A2U1IXJ1_SMIAN|nr:hypothetical protein BB558_006508 [Smittium angustum]
MGQTISKLLSGFFGKREIRILMVGLDAAGKTTILYKLKLGEIVTTIPNIGFSAETVQYKNINFLSWDLIHDNTNHLLYTYSLSRLFLIFTTLSIVDYQNTRGIIFVIDSNDMDLIGDARNELEHILNEKKLKDVPLLIFANKQDLPNAMTAAEITDKLGLHSIRQRQWYIKSSCAISGDGLNEGLQWLLNIIK